jgi:hypothetical protein
MTDFDTVAPTQGDNGNSFEWLWDIAAFVPNDPAPAWVNVPDITGLDPKPTNQMKDDTTYANKGKTSQAKIGEDFTLAVQVKGVKDLTGEFQPELLILLAATDPDSDGLIRYRYYHATSPSLAYQGTAVVEASRANTDNNSTEFFSFNMTGKGDRTKITNPGVTTPAPALSSALPSGAAEGELVTIKGSALTDASAVKFGASNASDYTVVNDNTIVASVPAGSAGSAAISVVTPAGTSDNLPYTRGA